MATNPYIILTDDDSGTPKTSWFRIIQGSYAIRRVKAQNIRTTIGGGIDVAMGDVYVYRSYICRCRETEDRSNHGSLSDLQHFFDLNDPNGDPSNVITFTDHYQQQPTNGVYMLGEFQEQPMGVEVEGLEAWFLVPIQFIDIP
jgi:hypothetical protein